MQAIILAAGMGKRLGDLTKDNTKCMVKVNGTRLIDRTLAQLDLLGLSQIILVIGYKGDQLRSYVDSLPLRTAVKFVVNDLYDKTNNIYSLYLARDFLLSDDTLLLESDLIFENSVIQALIDDERETLALVDKYESWMDGTCVTVDDNDKIIAFIPGTKFRYQDRDNYFKTVNIYKFSQQFSTSHYVPFLEAYCSALGNNEYYEQVLRVITMLDDPDIEAKRLTGQKWYEIDDIQDLDIASSIFCETTRDRYQSISTRYGGYWRYPKMLDFCYLVNPYYPPDRLKDELLASFDNLLTQYPSGANVCRILASKFFNLPFEYVVVGNGAAELISAIMKLTCGPVGIIRPTFEEYAARINDRSVCVFDASTVDYKYTADDVINHFTGTNIGCLILINPDNPSGNLVDKDSVITLLDWAAVNRIQVIIDESFMDFSDVHASVLSKEILDSYSNLIVVKSISKSYGVPGLRLGVAFTSNSEFIEEVQSEISIWNINSFAEFYLQIAGKYSSSYDESIKLLRQEREWLFTELQKFKQLTVYPSQANYIMVRLSSGLDAESICAKLLEDHDILIKDLSDKKGFSGGGYLRIAVRNRIDNECLLSALRLILD